MNVRSAILFVAFAGAAAAGAASSNEPIQPIRPPIVDNAAIVDLGKKLFFDPRLSRSGFISCNSCHNLSMGGTDNLPTSIGHNWQRGPINAPTVLNASMNVAQFWDGRAKDLQEQAGGPIANPGEMASSHDLAVGVIGAIPGYVAEFQRVFGTPAVTIDRITRAIAAFEETLVTPNARFDRWLAGESGALTAEELVGYQEFKAAGCTACHYGAAVGGGGFRKMGVAEPYHSKSDAPGRAAVTGRDADRMSFKVPTLRNVELTYPYFHDGAVDTLPDAVGIMGRVQMGKRLSDRETLRIAAFLRTLTGEQPSFPLPLLPPSADKTPRPQPFE